MFDSTGSCSYRILRGEDFLNAGDCFSASIFSYLGSTSKLFSGEDLKDSPGRALPLSNVAFV